MPQNTRKKWIAALLAVLSVVLFNITSRNFQPERLFAYQEEE